MSPAGADGAQEVGGACAGRDGLGAGERSLISGGHPPYVRRGRPCADRTGADRRSSPLPDSPGRDEKPVTLASLKGNFGLDPARGGAFTVRSPLIKPAGRKKLGRPRRAGRNTSRDGFAFSPGIFVNAIIPRFGGIQAFGDLYLRHARSFPRSRPALPGAAIRADLHPCGGLYPVGAAGCAGLGAGLPEIPFPYPPFPARLRIAPCPGPASRL